MHRHLVSTVLQRQRVRWASMLLAFAVVAAAVVGVVTPRAAFAASRTSHNIAYINYDDSGFTGSGAVTGNIFANAITDGPASTSSAPSPVTYNAINFTPVARAALSSRSLAPFDTLILFEICQYTTDFTGSQRDAINGYLNAGNKVLIFDADRCAPGDGGQADYGWFEFPFTTSSPGPHGAPGTNQIVEDSTLTQGLANDPFKSDELGDANTAISANPSWFAAAKTTNVLGNNGYYLAYARNKGLVIYNGADYWNTDEQTKSLTDIFLNELNQVYDPDNLPSSIPLAGTPTPTSPSTATPVPGVPTAAPVPAAAATPGPQTSWIYGYVYLQGTTTPVPNAEVYLTDTPLAQRTDSSGSFQFAGLNLTSGYGGSNEYGVAVVPPAGYSVVGTAGTCPPQPKLVGCQMATPTNGYGFSVTFHLARVGGYGKSTVSQSLTYVSADNLRTDAIRVNLKNDADGVLSGQNLALSLGPGSTVPSNSVTIRPAKPTDPSGSTQFTVSATKPGTAVWQVRVGTAIVPASLTTYFTVKAVILLQGVGSSLYGAKQTWCCDSNYPDGYHGSDVDAALGSLGYRHTYTVPAYPTSCPTPNGAHVINDGLVLDFSYLAGTTCVVKGTSTKILWIPQDYNAPTIEDAVKEAPTGEQMGTWLLSLSIMMEKYDKTYFQVFGYHVSYYLIGHSLGGKIAFEYEDMSNPYADTLRELPNGEVSSIVTIDSPLNAWPTPFSIDSTATNTKAVQAARNGFGTLTATVTNTADPIVGANLALISTAAYAHQWDVDSLGAPTVGQPDYSPAPQHGSLLHPDAALISPVPIDPLTDPAFLLAHVFAGTVANEPPQTLGIAVR